MTAVPQEPASSSPPASPPPAADDREADLARLGAESDTERAVKRIVPWIISIALHLGLVLMASLLTWTVVMLQRDEEPVRIVADFNAMQYDPVVRLDTPQTEQAEQVVQDRVETESLTDQIDDQLGLEIDPISLLAGPSEGELARFAPEPTGATATFVGLSSTNARRIVYVIDASGSMLRSLPIVLEELARSLDGLGPRQEFSIIFFQRNEALMVPPRTQLVPATVTQKMRVLAWIDERVIPEGRSNPLEAIELALSFRPDVVFLLSVNITGAEEYEIDQADLLALLDELNPRDPATGRRRTQINCVQFLDPDPLGTLEKIAAEHGGERGYKFLDREELGLRAP